MKDEDKSEEQLLGEVAEMRRSIEEMTAIKAELRRTGEELQLLQNIIWDISKAENAQSTLHAVLKRICKVTGWVYGEVWLPSSDGSFMERSPVLHSSSDGLDEFGKASESFIFYPGEGLPGRVWSSKQPIWVKDVTQDSEYLRAEIARKVGLKTALAIPILAQDKVVAVMVFYLFKERGEDDRFVELVSAVAAQLGSIMRHKQIEDATSYSIIRKHEGHITVESEPGSGTTFHIYLPASKKEIEAKIAREEKPAERGGRVLIMDDEEVLRESVGDLLRHLGYEVETAADGLEAIDKYSKAKDAGVPFNVVIMDLTIPGGMGGKDAVKRLLEIDPGARAVVSSGYSNDPIMADFRRFGFTGVVVKPYKIEELTDTLDRVIAGK